MNHLMFTDDICVFSPGISRIHRLLNICGGNVAENEIAFNCNKTSGIIFCLKKCQQPAPSNVILNGVYVQFSDQVKYLGVLLTVSLKDVIISRDK